MRERFMTVPPTPSHSTLYALGEVSEVEEVVGLGRSGEEVRAHASIDLHTGIHYGFGSIFDRSRKLGKETLGDGLKDSANDEYFTMNQCQSTAQTPRGLANGVVLAYLEDGLQADLRGLREAEHGKVPDHARGDRVTTAPWGGTRCTDSDVL